MKGGSSSKFGVCNHNNNGFRKKANRRISVVAE